MIRIAALACAALTAVGVVAVAPSATAAGPKQPGTTVNLIQNGGAESGPGSVGNETNTPPNWTVTTGTSFTALIYGQTATGGPTPTSPGPAKRGANLFAGGYNEALDVGTQLRSIPTTYRAAIDAGTATFDLQAFLGGWESQGDNATLSVEWRRSDNTALATSTLGPVTAAQRANVTGLKFRHLTAAVPVGARRVLITLTLTREGGAYNDGYADNLSLKLTMPTA